MTTGFGVKGLNSAFGMQRCDAFAHAHVQYGCTALWLACRYEHEAANSSGLLDTAMGMGAREHAGESGWQAGADAGSDLCEFDFDAAGVPQPRSTKDLFTEDGLGSFAGNSSLGPLA